MGEEYDRLYRRIREGDKDAASELLRSLHGCIYTYLRRLCGNDSIAEDLLQETFIRVWASLPSFRGESGLATWIHRIAYSVHVDWYRKSRKDAMMFTSWVEEYTEFCDPDRGPLENLSKKQEAIRLYRAVEKLDENQRNIIYLHYYQHLSLRDTAYVLNTAVSTVKYRLRRALTLLKPILSD